MKTRSILLALSSIAVLGALTACSSVMPSAANGPEGTAPAATTAPPAKSYTADDLTAILTAAETTLGVSGTILDDAKVKAAAGQLSGAGGLSALLSGPGVSITPESCGTKVSTALSAAPSADSLAAVLSYGTNAVTVVTNNKPASDLLNDSDAQYDSLLGECGSMQLTATPPGGEPQTGNITLEKLAVTTDAEKTVGIKETVAPPASAGIPPIVMQLAIAAQGNVLVTATAVNSADATSVVDAINAVVAEASKQ